MLIGRKKEQKLLTDAFYNSESDFIAVYGRRRVGKTYLIRETFEGKFAFQHSGLAKGNKSDQLAAFRNSLIRQSGQLFPVFKSWLDAFFALESWIDSLPEGKKVIFLDELSWMDTHRSKFLEGLEYFWNSYASARKDILLIVCGSATSWIINKLFRNHGGLHNRVTGSIRLQQFNLSECREYSSYLGMEMTDSEIIDSYMILGGIPFYWKQLNPSLSLAQNIDTLFFNRKGNGLVDEFNSLYSSIYNNPGPYMRIVDALAGKRKGLTRNELVETLKIRSNGDLSHQLDELEWCGFIRKYSGFKKKAKDALFQLIDNFSIFYYNFMRDGNNTDEHFWTNSIGTPAFNTWTGLSFETVCLEHIAQIKSALGIAGVSSNIYSLITEENPEKGIEKCQIDLLIDRRDKVVNLCEMKYSNDSYVINADEETKLRNRKSNFLLASESKKAVHITLITPFGVKRNKHSGIAQQVITLEDLFKPIQ